jgi:hypothetical protein
MPPPSGVQRQRLFLHLLAREGTHSLGLTLEAGVEVWEVGVWEVGVWEVEVGAWV